MKLFCKAVFIIKIKKCILEFYSVEAFSFYVHNFSCLPLFNVKLACNVMS